MIRILIRILLDISNLWMEKSIEIGMLYIYVGIYNSHGALPFNSI